MFKKIVLAAVVAVACASAPAQAIDLGTALVVQSGASVVNTAIRVNGRPCYRPYIIDRFGHCIMPRRRMVVYNNQPVVNGPAVVEERVIADPSAGNMSPEKLEQLKGLLAERAQAVLGPAPEGLAYKGYQEVQGTSKDNPCMPGFHVIKMQNDPTTNRTFARCASGPAQ